ncbi:MAG: hypothetical protein ACI84K_001804 [Pseudohongiellaceae bacterium]|jgi:hypothetical protein
MTIPACPLTKLTPSFTLLAKLTLILLTYFYCHVAIAKSENNEPYLTILPDAFDDSSWALMINKDGVQVYTRSWPGSNFVAIKGVQTINSSLSNILANFIDIAAFPEWVKDAKEGFVITPFDQTRTRKVYLRMHLPWPLADRDIVSGQRVTQDLTTKIIQIKEWYEGDVLPKNEGVIRIPRLNTEFLLIPKEKNITKLIWQGHNDPGGFIPPFLVNWLIEEVFFTSMLTMKKRFESPKYDKTINWVHNFED